MNSLALAVVLFATATDTVTIEERIDLYDPTTSAYLGTERTWFDLEGRRLRQRVVDSDGAQTLLFILIHDEEGRESGAIYFEGDATEPTREAFTYSSDGRLKTTTYYAEPDVPGERTESDLDDTGREVHKRYYRADGSQYGEEDVLWLEDGRQGGWDFRYVEREGGASFRYEYEGEPDTSEWVRRVRIRDGVAERIEVRSPTITTKQENFLNPATFAPGSVSTERFETSPSFSTDGRTMVFARYDDWDSKVPHIGRLGEHGWTVEPMSGLDTVYNLAIAPDGKALFFSDEVSGTRQLSRVTLKPDGWSGAQDLTKEFGVVGTYPSLTGNGDLFLFDAEGVSGPGIYLARARGDRFDEQSPVFTPEQGIPFDAFPVGARQFLLTRCFDDRCASGSRNGVWYVDVGEAEPIEHKIPTVSYGWGAQIVEPLGLFVYTDGEDILALPLSVVKKAIPK